MKFFVAEVDNRVIGMTMVSNTGRISYISTVMVRPNYRRKGIATKLMKSALNYVQEKKKRAILHVITTNTPAKNLYTKLGFEKFENIIHLVGDVDSLLESKDINEVKIRPFQKSDINEVYNLIKISEDPNRLRILDFRKNSLKTPLMNRILHFSTEKKIVAIRNDRIVGYAQASYTTPKEAARIGNVQAHPEDTVNAVEKTLINETVKQIKPCGTKTILATVPTTRQELIEIMTKLGFRKHLEMEGMFLETHA